MGVAIATWPRPGGGLRSAPAGGQADGARVGGEGRAGPGGAGRGETGPAAGAGAGPSPSGPAGMSHGFGEGGRASAAHEPQVSAARWRGRPGLSRAPFPRCRAVPGAGLQPLIRRRRWRGVRDTGSVCHLCRR